MTNIQIFSIDEGTSSSPPFAVERADAGFPAPAQNHMTNSIDLNRELVHHPESTFYARMEGDSMVDAHLFAGDIIIVDRSIALQSGDMAVCIVEGEFTVRFVDLYANYALLRPANDKYPVIKVSSEEGFEIWGIATHVIHTLR